MICLDGVRMSPEGVKLDPGVTVRRDGKGGYVVLLDGVPKSRVTARSFMMPGVDVGALLESVAS